MAFAIGRDDGRGVAGRRVRRDDGFIVERAPADAIALDRRGSSFGFAVCGCVQGAADVKSRPDAVIGAKWTVVVCDREHGHHPG